MTTSPNAAPRPGVLAGRPTWRVSVASGADRLDAQLDAALAATGQASGTGPAATARDAICRARAIATGTAKRGLRDWWYGTSIESAWQALHLAAEQLAAVQPASDLRASAPQLAALARRAFGPERAKAEEQAVGQWSADPAAQPDPRVAQRILTAYHASSDRHQQQARGLRNLMYVMGAVVMALDAGLWAAGVSTGVVVGLGALAGALSVVFVLRTGTPAGPYNLLPGQSLLKVGSGAATALMATKILDFISGVHPSAGRDAMYAVIFGFSQQAFTRLVDQEAGSLARGPDARSGPISRAAWAAAGRNSLPPASAE
ncbi:MAG: hypothetical protein ABJB47_07740 [Actinomycetota bacterium]